MFDAQRRMNYPNYEEGAMRINEKGRGKRSSQEAILEDSFETEPDRRVANETMEEGAARKK
jgi:hypothetical protein